MTVLARPTDVEELSGLLDRAAIGDAEAFMTFYDATHACVFTLALARARLLGVGEAEARRAAEADTVQRYSTAWRTAASRRESGLSPMAWLLTLDAAPEHESAACA